MDSLPEEFFEELNELLKVEALDELEKEAKCGMDELVEKFEALDYLVGSNAEEESNYWEMKAESHYGI
jgi:hypothetical protein